MSATPIVLRVVGRAVLDHIRTNGPATVREIVDSTGHREKAVYTTVSELLEAGDIVATGERRQHSIVSRTAKVYDVWRDRG